MMRSMMHKPNFSQLPRTLGEEGGETLYIDSEGHEMSPRGAWLAQWAVCATLHLRVLSLMPTVGVEITEKKKEMSHRHFSTHEIHVLPPPRNPGIYRTELSGQRQHGRTWGWMQSRPPPPKNGPLHHSSHSLLRTILP